MKNKRLLGILLVFIFVGGIAIGMGTAFSIRTISINFTNATDYIADEGAAISTMHTAASGVAMNRNIIFSLDRDALTEAIEAADVRVRVTNIEARFPNTLEIRVRERYPVYRFVCPDSDRTLMMDSQLRIVAERVLTPNRHIINITEQLRVEGTAAAGVGDYLCAFIVICPIEQAPSSRELIKAERLRDLAALFAGQRNYEDSINHLFHSIEFPTDNSVGEGLNLRLNLREPNLTNHGRNQVVIDLFNIEDAARFRIMLTYTWRVMINEARDMPGRFEAFFLNDGTDRLWIVAPSRPGGFTPGA